MRQPIRQRELFGHLQKLRQIFALRFKSTHHDNFEIKSNHSAGPGVYFVLQDNSSTVQVVNDRHANEVCAVLAASSKKRILCSFYEGWQISRPKNPQYQFARAALTFFVAVEQGQQSLKKQLFRLEWDNWLDQDMPNKAAYPHWQFDRWLTASDISGVELSELRASFENSRSEALIFKSAKQQETSDNGLRVCRPNLGWFTRLHFPSYAPWATHPIQSLDDPKAPQSHRSIPDSVTQIEDWINSALCYLKNELETYE